MLSHVSRIGRVSSRGLASAASGPIRTPLIINGQKVDSQTDKWIEVRNPATQEVVRLVPEATQAEMREAVVSASAAFKEWKSSTILTRQRKMLDLQAAIRANMDKLATHITTEQGKTFEDARGDVLRGLRTNTLNKKAFF